VAFCEEMSRRVRPERRKVGGRAVRVRRRRVKRVRKWRGIVAGHVRLLGRWGRTGSGVTGVGSGPIRGVGV